jgi:leucyl-tRNA synthetase
LHHLYARFIWKAMCDLDHLPREVGQEPFKQLRLHGWVLRDGAKMSKSRGNVVNPDEYVRQQGADVVRMHVLFMGSYTEGGDWRDSAINGIVRYYKRLWEWVTSDATLDEAGDGDERMARRALHKAIKKVGEDIPALNFNTAIAALMETLNVLRRTRLPVGARAEIGRTYVLLLAPFAPFLAEELWERLGGAFSVHQQNWPTFDPRLVVDEIVEVPIQVNGKLRDRLGVAPDIAEAEIKQQVLARPAIRKHTQDRRIVRFIYRPGRLVNIVVE